MTLWDIAQRTCEPLTEEGMRRAFDRAMEMGVRVEPTFFAVCLPAPAPPPPPYVDLRRGIHGRPHAECELSKFPPNLGKLVLMDGTEVLL